MYEGRSIELESLQNSKTKCVKCHCQLNQEKGTLGWVDCHNSRESCFDMVIIFRVTAV